MTIWVPQLAGRTGPIYRSLADAIATGVERGDLSPGAQLPTQRDLAGALGIALTTVTRAYAEAERRGLVRGEVGRGTFVRTRSSSGPHEEAGADGDLDLRPNTLLPWAHGPELLDGLARIVTASDPGRVFDYGPHRGNLRGREAASEWLGRKGIPTEADQVLITAGAQHAMTVVLGSLATAGDEILVEELSYAGIRSLAHVLGLRLRPVALDAEGLRPDALREACAQGTPKALYCIPTLHNPTGAVMSEARRREIASIAAEAGVPIVEDDSYGFILPDVVPLAGLVTDAYYLTGTSKPLVPALRVGILRAPRTAVPRLEAAIAATVYMASPLATEIVSTWMEDGTADRIMAWKREQFGIRQGIARRLFAGWDYSAHPRSPHGWLRLPEPWTAREFVAQAALRGVHISAADDFATGRSAPHAVRLCVGPTPSRGHLEEGLQKLATMLRSAPEAGRVVV